MSSKRPSRLFLWGYGAAPGALVEPPSGTAETGFATAQRPPAQWINALFNNFGDWNDFLRGPNLGEWTRRLHNAAPGALLAGSATLAVDPDTLDGTDAAFRYCIAGQIAGPVNGFLCSRRGYDWVWRENLPPAATGTLGGVIYMVTPTIPGGWWCWTDDAVLGGQLFGTSPDVPGGGSAVGDTATLWLQFALPGGTSGLRGIASKLDQVAAITRSALVVSTDGGTTWGAAAWGAGTTGTGLDIRHDGTSFVAITSDGHVMATTDVLGVWTKVAEIGALDWRLATDGDGTLVAYEVGSVAAGFAYVSTDQGATWTGLVVPVSWTHITHLRYADGTWIATSTDLPYLWESSDLVNWRALPVPLDESGLSVGLEDVAYVDGAWVATGLSHTVTSGRARDTASGLWVPGAAPTAVADAGFLRGVQISSTPPAAGQVLLFNGTQWAPTYLYLEGSDTARPAAAAALGGLEFRGSDTGATYVCRGASGWLVRSAGDGPDRATTGTFGAADYLSAVSPVAAPELAAGQSLVLLLWPTAVPAGPEVLACHGDAALVRGWELRVGDNAWDLGELSLWLSGLNGGVPIQLAGATWAGVTGAMHTLAVTITAAGDIHYSWDGAATVTIAAPAGAYVPPIAADPLVLGQSAALATPSADCDLCALRTYSTEVSDVDLEAAGAAAVRTAGRLPALTGTCTLDVGVARLAGQDGYALPPRWKAAGSLALAFATNGTLLKTAR